MFPAETVIFSSLVILTAVLVVWGGWKGVTVTGVALAVFGLCAWCIQSCRGWVYACVAATLVVPPVYPAALGGVTPIYVCNFVLLIGCVALLVRYHEFRLLPDSISQASFLFLTALLVSLPFAYWLSGASASGQSLLRFLLILQPFFVYVWIRGFPCFQSISQLERFVKLLLGLGVAAAVYGIVDFYYPIPIPHPFADQYIYLDFKHIRRAQGMLYEASSFGNLCAFFLALTLCLLFGKQQLSNLYRAWLFLGTGIFTMAVFLSYSRGSWAAVMVAISAFLIVQRQLRPRIVLLLFLILGSFVYLVYQLSPEVVANFFSWRLGNLAEFWDDPDSATSGRWQSWTTLIQFFADRLWLLLFGIGYKTIPFTDLFGTPLVADNGYLSLLFETGILGLAAFLWLNWAILKTLRDDGQTTSPVLRLCRTFLFAFWCGEMVQMLTGDIFTYWRNLTVLFAMIAAVLAIDQVPPPGATQVPRSVSSDGIIRLRD
jgi:hypothetical protein